MRRVKVTPQIFAGLSGTLMLMVCGFHMGWPSPALPKILSDVSVPVTSAQGTWLVSFGVCGSALGPIVNAMVVDRWGRKTALLLTSIPMTISSLLIAFAQSYWWYYIGRFIVGFGIGSTITVCPMYLGEIADDAMRGGFSILLTIMLNSGFLLCYSVGPWVSGPMLIAVGMLVLCIQFLTFIWMPETPYYYHMINKPENAKKSLQWLRGRVNVEEENEIVKRNVELDMKNAGTFKELVTDKGNRKAIFIIVGLFTAQQISGASAILCYSTMIFDTVGIGISSTFSVIMTGIAQLIASVIVGFSVNSVGRRPLLLSSIFISVIFLLGTAIFFQLQINDIDIGGISWLPVTAIVGFLCSYTVGLGVLPMSLITEIFPCNIKAKATMIGMVYLSVAATFVIQIYPTVSATYGIHVAFYSFAIASTLSIIFVFYYVPETKGKSLSEIQDMLHGRSSDKSNKISPDIPISIHDSKNFLGSIYSISGNGVPESNVTTSKQ